MNKKLNIILNISIIFFTNSFSMPNFYKIASKKIYYKNTYEIIIDKKLDISDKTILIPKNHKLEIKPQKGCARLILNKNSKIILGENSQLILKGIVFEGTSVKDNFTFNENSKVLCYKTTTFITEIKDLRNPPLTKKPFFIDDEDKINFEIKIEYYY